MILPQIISPKLQAFSSIIPTMRFTQLVVILPTLFIARQALFLSSTYWLNYLHEPYLFSASANQFLNCWCQDSFGVHNDNTQTCCNQQDPAQSVVQYANGKVHSPFHPITLYGGIDCSREWLSAPVPYPIMLKLTATPSPCAATTRVL